VELRSDGKLRAGSLGGVLAVTAAFAGFVSQLATGGAVGGTTGLTLVFVLAAGVIALLRPNLIEALVVADVLVALSVLIEMLGRLGLLYLPSLMLLVFATMRAEELPEREARQVAAAIPPMIASQWDRIRMRREASAPESIGEVPAASAESLRRAG
jgi:hypothetical protein